MIRIERVSANDYMYAFHKEIGPHYVLAIGYFGNGDDLSDYIIIDPEGIYNNGIYEKGSEIERMDIFYEHFPHETYVGKGYKYKTY